MLRPTGLARSHGQYLALVDPVDLRCLLVRDSVLLLIHMPHHPQVFLLNSSPCNICLGLTTTWITNQRHGIIRCNLRMAWATHLTPLDLPLKDLLIPAFPYPPEINLRHSPLALRPWPMLFHTPRTLLNLPRRTSISLRLALAACPLLPRRRPPPLLRAVVASIPMPPHSFPRPLDRTRLLLKAKTGRRLNWNR